MANEFDVIKENKGGIIEVSYETYEYALEVLPPVRAANCWGMGEIASHTSSGEEEYFYFGSVKKPGFENCDFYDWDKLRYFAFLGTQTEAEKVFEAIKGKGENWN